MSRLTFPAWELVRRRGEEALREIGILLVAFAPLDLAFSEGTRRVGIALLFLMLGVLLFGYALVLETRRLNA